MASGSSRSLANNNILFYRRRKSGSGAGSDADFQLLNETQGLALDFTDDFFYASEGFYGSARIKDTGTPANEYNSSPTKTASSLLTYTSPSVKMCMGPSGTLRYGAHNLYVQSEDFTGGSWFPGDCTYVGNDAVSPNGTTTADKVTASAGLFRGPGQSTAKIAGATYEQSVYAKNGDIGWIKLEPDSGNYQAWFDIATGVVGATTGTGVTSGIESAGNGWYRCWLRWPQAATRSNTDSIRLTDANSSQTATAGKFCYLWGAQFRRTPSDSTYLATTSAARYALPLQWTSAGVLEGMLVEEARTNLCLRSQELDNAAWSLSGSTISANATTSPDGTTTADKLQEDTATSNHSLSQTMTVSSGATYTISFYAKASERNYVGLYEISSNSGKYFDLTGSGAVLGNLGNAPVSSSIQSVGSGWYRCVVSVLTTSTTLNPFFYTSDTGARTSYTGTSGSGIFIWGGQAELGSFPTSYIPTIASTVTRAADNISLATSAFPFSATASTLYARYVTGPNVTLNNYAATLNDGTTNEFIGLRISSAFSTYYVIDGGAIQAGTNFAAAAINTEYKAAVAAALNDVNYAVNGAADTTDTSATMPTGNRLTIGSAIGAPAASMLIKSVAYYPRRMSNAELQTLTA